MTNNLDEQLVEDAAGACFAAVGVSTRHGPALDDVGERPGLSAILLAKRAKAALRKLNPHLPAATIDAVVASLSRPPHPTLIENNRHFHSLLTDGVPVEYKDAKTGEMRGGRARLIDFDNPAKAESSKLAALRDYLLPRLLSGRVRVTRLPGGS